MILKGSVESMFVKMDVADIREFGVKSLTKKTLSAFLLDTKSTWRY